MKTLSFILLAVIFASCGNQKAAIVEQIKAKQAEAEFAHTNAAAATEHYGAAHDADIADINLEAHWSEVEVKANHAIDSLNLELKKY